MKRTPVLLLLLLCSASAHAEIYRCETIDGQVSYQDVACPAQVLEQAGAPAAENAAMEAAYIEPEGYLPGGWTTQQRRHRRHEAKIESTEAAERTRLQLQPINDRRAVEDAQASHRCHLAKRVAALCGADTSFSCTDKGFRAEPLTRTSVSAAGAGGVDHASAFSRSQCALQATRGRY